MSDVYDDEVARLTANPKLIESSWLSAEPLFRFMTKSGRHMDSTGKMCGCPSTVKLCKFSVDTSAKPGLQDMIKDLPLRSATGTNYRVIIASLPFYAQAQRLGDQMIPGRIVPVAAVKE